MKTASTTNLDRNRALIIRRTIMNGMGKMRRSVSKLAQVTHISISPILVRPMQCKPPNVLDLKVFPVCGGHMKI